MQVDAIGLKLTKPSPLRLKRRRWKLTHYEKKNDDGRSQEGEAALNEMFQKIYADASDETKRAMNKSFQVI